MLFPFVQAISLDQLAFISLNGRTVAPAAHSNARAATSNDIRVERRLDFSETAALAPLRSIQANYTLRVACQRNF
jgi:hypothetical protein